MLGTVSTPTGRVNPDGRCFGGPGGRAPVKFWRLAGLYKSGGELSVEGVERFSIDFERRLLVVLRGYGMNRIG